MSKCSYSSEKVNIYSICIENKSCFCYFLPGLYDYRSSGGLVTKLCLTLAAPWTVAHQAPLSMGFPRQEYWSGLPVPFPGHLSHPGIEPTSPAVACRFFTTEPPRKMIIEVTLDYLDVVGFFF